MNRSQRRAPAISWAFTAALIFAGVGAPGVAVSSADPGPSGQAGQHRERGSVSDRSAVAAAGADTVFLTAPSSRGGRVAPSLPVGPGGRGSVQSASGQARSINSMPRPAQSADRIPPGLPRTAPPPPVTFSLPDAATAESVPAPVSIPPGRLPVSEPSRPAAPVPAPAPSQGALSAVLRPVTPVLGGTGQLAPTNLRELASLALPGLVGLLALTAVGGFFGYRQAKAGFVVHSAGTARFLQ